MGCARRRPPAPRCTDSDRRLGGGPSRVPQRPRVGRHWPTSSRANYRPRWYSSPPIRVRGPHTPSCNTGFTLFRGVCCLLPYGCLNFTKSVVFRQYARARRLRGRGIPMTARNGWSGLRLLAALAALLFTASVASACGSASAASNLPAAGTPASSDSATSPTSPTPSQRWSCRRAVPAGPGRYETHHAGVQRWPRCSRGCALRRD